MNKSSIDNIFIYWVYFISLIFIVSYALESLGFLSSIFQEDISYLSSLITFILIFYLFQCGYYLYKLRDAVFFIETKTHYDDSNPFIIILSEFQIANDILKLSLIHI